MNDVKFRFNASLQKSGSKKDGRIPIVIIPNHPSPDRVNDTIISKAFLNAREEFLKTGVIDWDHQTVRGKDPLEKATAIVGQPVDLRVENGVPVCEAFLFEKNPFVQQAILPALESESTVLGASVGGNVLKSEEIIEKGVKGKRITSIYLNHIAITPLQKAVHPRTSVSLRKSEEEGDVILFNDYDALVKGLSDTNELYKALEAGAVTDIAAITGGQAIQGQDLEGAQPGTDYDHLRNVMDYLVMAIMRGEIATGAQMNEFMNNHRLTDKEKAMVIDAISKNQDRIKKFRDGTF